MQGAWASPGKATTNLSPSSTKLRWRTVIEPQVPVRVGLHLLGHVLEGGHVKFLPARQDELDVGILPVGLRGVVHRAGLIVLKEEKQVLPLHLIPGFGKAEKSVSRSSCKPR